MSITSIKRDFVNDPAIVKIITSDDYDTITAAGYFAGQQSNIEAINKGVFVLSDGDMCQIKYSDGEGFFTYDSTNGILVNETDAGSLIQHVQVDVDLATFIAAYSASVLLVAAPGANKKLNVHRATLWIDYGGVVLANGGAMHVQYDSTVNGAGTKATGTQAAAGLIAATADTTFGFSPVDTTLTDATTLNKGLYLAMATADFTGGTGSAYKVDLWYSVSDLS